MKKIYLSFLLCTSLFLVNAQWSNNTNLNTLVAGKDASDIQTVNTSDGRTWIAFYSNTGNNYDMRAQLLDANGNRMFGDSGVVVSNKKSGSATFVFNVCVDNDNNFIIAFQVAKGSAYECVMQKVGLSGQLLWGSSGIDLGAGLSPYPATLSTNEIAVAWNNNGKINYQKVSTTGVAAWPSPKIFGGNSTHIVSRAQVVANTNGKFSMVYQDQFSPPFYTNLFEQKFDNSGNILWASAVKISSLSTVSYRYYDVHAEDDTTYVGFYGNPSGTNRFDAYIQRINADGSLPWGINGSAFADFSTSSDPYEQTIYIAKQKGSTAVWAVCTITNIFQTTSAVYAQKLDALTGARYLGNNAKKLSPLSSRLIKLAFCKLSLCGNEPLFLVTDDVSNKLLAVKLKADGSVAFASGVATSNNVKYRYGFTDTYNGQAVAVWQEDKGTGTMAYAQNILCDGSTGLHQSNANTVKPLTATTLSIKSFYPNPVQNNLTATITSSIQCEVHIYITDVNGNVYKQFDKIITKGDNLIQLNLTTLRSGNYFIKVVNEYASAGSLFMKQ